MPKYKRKEVVDAVQWIGYNLEEMLKFLKDNYASADVVGGDLHLSILEDVFIVQKDEWMVKQTATGEFHKLTDAAFKHLYESA